MKEPRPSPKTGKPDFTPPAMGSEVESSPFHELTIQDIKRLLASQPIEQNLRSLQRLQDLENRGVRLTPIQANLMFFNRSYGKTFMSYCMIAETMREMFNCQLMVLVGFNVWSEHHINPKNYDPDLIKYDHEINKKIWMNGFLDFLAKHFPEFEVIEKKQFMVSFKMKGKK